MTLYMYEYDTGNKFGVASEESQQKYTEALQKGCPFFMYPYHGYELRMVVHRETSRGGAGEEISQR